MQKVLTAQQMREVDRLTTERYGIPSILLMENAAHAVARVISDKLGGSVREHDVVVLCGKGNNGGDGAALARLLWTQWCDVDIYLFGSVEETKGDARTNFEMLQKLSRRQPPFYPALMLYENATWDEKLANNIGISSIVIDALFGTGLTRPLDAKYAELFEGIGDVVAKKRKRPLLCSIDIPSGLSADAEADFEPYFQPDVTVTLTAPKPGNVLAPNSSRNGELFVGDIGTPYEMVLDSPSKLVLAGVVDLKEWLRKSKFTNSSYKNKRGHALLIAGSGSYSGAAVLCGNAAMRSGVGLVTIVTPRSSKDSVASRALPEVMVRGVAETENGAILDSAFDEICDLLEKADSVAIGSGISQDESTKKFVQKVIKNRQQPMIVDADALNLLSPFVSSPHVSKGSAGENHPVGETPPPPTSRKEGSCLLILTPHEGEFMRLLGTDDKDAIKDRVVAVRDFAQKHDVIIVLKGERVLIGEPSGKVVVNPTGNSGLGKAGNGDTLTGILAGFIAQAAKMNVDIFETVVAAVYVAGMAGDIAEQKYGKRVMTASDVRECLVEAFESLKP